MQFTVQFSRIQHNNQTMNQFFAGKQGADSVLDLRILEKPVNIM